MLKFEIMQDDSSSPKQTYNADETSLYWCILDSYLYAHQDESYGSAGFKANNERLSALCCANAAGAHKIKSLVIG